MIRYVIFIFTVSLLPALFLLLNCTQQVNPGGARGAGDSQGGEGWTPAGGGASRGQAHNGWGEGFSPNQSFSYSQAGHSDTDDDDDPFRKSLSVQDNEKKWGVSAPIGEVGDDEVDQDVLQDFLLGEEINSMDDIVDLRVYVKLKKSSERTVGTNKYKTYGGQVTIAYYDYHLNKPRKVSFNSGTSSGDTKYNLWWSRPITTALLKHFPGKFFHGFFEETDGSLILVIDSAQKLVTDSEDPDAPTTLYGGSVWIMMFKEIFPVSQSKGNSCAKRDGLYVRHYNQSGKGTLTKKKKCWHISKGPFDCRAWREGKGVNTFKSFEPDNNCYTKLGEFSGLDIVKAFGVKTLENIQ